MKQTHPHELSFLYYLFWLYMGSIPVVSWPMRAVKQPSSPALHHVSVTSAVGSSQLLICCLELASWGLASVKPLNDKIQDLSSLSPCFSIWTNAPMFETWGWLFADMYKHLFTYTLSRENMSEQAYVYIQTPTQEHTFSPLPQCFLKAKQKTFDLSAA